MRAFAMGAGSGLVGTLAVLLVGCEETPPPTPAGAFAFQFVHAGPCDLKTHNALMGVVGAEGEPDLISNGAEGAEVSCTVETVGGGYRIIASLNSGANLQLTVPSISTKNDTESSATEGSVNYVSSDTGGEVYSATACKFWVAAKDQYVQPGAAWVSFECAEIQNEGSICGIDRGFFTVKNCDGATEEEE